MRSENNTPTQASKLVRTKKGAWPPGIDERLREACALGVTAAELAIELGRSRAAVSGRLHRLGVKVRKARTGGLATPPATAAPTKAQACHTNPRVAHARSARTGARLRPFRARTVVVASSPACLAELGPNACRYCTQDTPPGYMEQALFCAAATEPGQPYCPAHRDLALLGRRLNIDALTLDLASHLARSHL